MTVCMTALESAEERRLFEDVYRACCGRMLALARRRLSAQADAEDAVQQSFLALAERFSRLAKLPETQLEADLVVTVERKCIDILRQQARRDGAPFDETAALPPRALLYHRFHPPGELRRRRGAGLRQLRCQQCRHPLRALPQRTFVCDICHTVNPSFSSSCRSAALARCCSFCPAP